MLRLGALYTAAFNSAAGVHSQVHHLPTHHVHHRFSGSPVDYYSLAAAAAASWVGLPGPGEPVLIAAGILAAKGKLDIASVLIVAWAAATGGGVGGWLLGMKAGRRLLTIRGPLHNLRRAAMARGDAVFKRYTVLAIVLTPSWVAGIHRVRSSLYLPVNAIAALAWAVGIGLGSYYAGPPVLDVVADLGSVTGIIVVVVIVGVVAAEVIRRRRRRRSPAPERTDPA